MMIFNIGKAEFIVLSIAKKIRCCFSVAKGVIWKRRGETIAKAPRVNDASRHVALGCDFALIVVLILYACAKREGRERLVCWRDILRPWFYQPGNFNLRGTLILWTCVTTIKKAPFDYLSCVYYLAAFSQNQICFDISHKNCISLFI